MKKDKKGGVEEVKKEKRPIQDKDRHKPFGKTAWVPVDDVFILKYYPRTVYGAAEAIQMLKRFQVLDFTPHNQPVYIDLKLDMKLEKKVTAGHSLYSSFSILSSNRSDAPPPSHRGGTATPMCALVMTVDVR